MRNILIYNKDQLKSLCRGCYDKAVNLFRKKIPLVHESKGDAFCDKTIFIIRRGGNVGLFSYFLTALSGMKYAFDRGWLPVVDLQTQPNIYLESSEVGRVNAWEYYFEQPVGLSLADVSEARDVLITKDFPWPELPPADVSFLRNKDRKLAYWRNFVSRHVRIKPHILSAVADEERRIFGNHTDDVLGVFLRGTDYARLHPVNHTVQPTVETAICDTCRLLEDCSCTRVFLVSEDKSIHAAFRRAFGDKLLVKEQNLVDYRGGYIGESVPDFRRDKERYLQGLEYLMNILLLARCPNILASRASGSIAVALLEHIGQNVRYYDLGVYRRFGVSGGVEGGLS